MNTNLQLDWEVSPIDVNYEFGKKQIFEIPLGFFSGSSTGAVSSVNGKFGDVVLGANDVGAVAKAELLPIQNELTQIENQVSQLEQNKLDKIDYVQHFRGVFTDIASLQTAVPVGVDGDYAHLDLGLGFDRTVAIWDTSDSKWVTSSATVGANTDEIPEGNTNLYFKSQRVLSTPLSGLSTGSNTEITGSDTVLTAFAKLQSQISAQGVTWVKASQVGTINSLFQPSAVIGSATVDLEFANINGFLYMRGAYTCLADISVGARLITLNNAYKVRAYIYGNVSNFTVAFNVYYRTNPTIENALVILSPSQVLDPISAQAVDQSINHYTGIDGVGKTGVWIVGGMGNLVCLGELINK